MTQTIGRFRVEKGRQVGQKNSKNHLMSLMEVPLRAVHNQRWQWRGGRGQKLVQFADRQYQKTADMGKGVSKIWKNCRRCLWIDGPLGWRKENLQPQLRQLNTKQVLNNQTERLCVPVALAKGGFFQKVRLVFLNLQKTILSLKFKFQVQDSYLEYCFLEVLDI